MKKHLLAFAAVVMAAGVNAQVTIQSGAVLYIGSGAKVTLQGDLTSSADIQGPGTLTMRGSGAQQINMNGFTIPNLEIDNAANVNLTGGNARIGSSLLFTNGKLNNALVDLILSNTATVSGQNTSRFIWTSATGQVRKELTADISNFEIPVGENSNYRPVYLTTSGGSYSTANVGVRVVSGADPNKPPYLQSMLATHWPVTRTGITGGTVTLGGQYIDPSDVSGTESNLVGYYFNGTDWSSVGETHDATANRVSAPVTNATGTLTGLNKFLTIGSRAFLQGAYINPTIAGLMNDNLRQGTNLIPVGDPYRTATYSSAFAHVDNPGIGEIASASVFANQASATDDIVDWVFLELRTTTYPGNTVLQTRSALLQRDGDIVDIDGVSPVTFNNLPNGAYTLAVRHRNHLGLSTDPSSNPRTFSETKSIAFTSNVADLRNTADGGLFGPNTAYATASHPGLGSVNLLWTGNANLNTNVKYQGLNNDLSQILSEVLAFPGNSSQLYNYGSATGYFRGDVNMNRVVRYVGLNNDASVILANILLFSSLYNNQLLIQHLPN